MRVHVIVGNYLDMNLPMAKYEAKVFLENTLNQITDGKFKLSSLKREIPYKVSLFLMFNSYHSLVIKILNSKFILSKH